MNPRNIISQPAGYITPFALGYADEQGDLTLVTSGAPLPVASARGEVPAPLEGETGTSMVAGPFVPAPDVPMHLQLTGTWTGSVIVKRSVDGGDTSYPLTLAGAPWAQFTANANEAIWQEGEEAASFWLDITLASGALAYRMSQ